MNVFTHEYQASLINNASTRRGNHSKSSQCFGRGGLSGLVFGPANVLIDYLQAAASQLRIGMRSGGMLIGTA